MSGQLQQLGDLSANGWRPVVRFALLSVMFLHAWPCYAAGQDAVHSQGASSQSAGATPLDELLLQETPAVTSGERQFSTSPATETPGAGEPAERSLDQASDPLTEISWKMRAAGERLVERSRAGEGLNLQREILRDLEQLLQRTASAQSQRSQAGAASRQTTSEQAQTEGDQGESASGEGNPSGEADQENTGIQARQVQAALDKVWGHLPEQLRDQVRSASIETFLPKYERLIELYYRRLSEGDTD